MAYDPSDWYWQVAGDTVVWSSDRLEYVTTDDAAYQTFLTNGGTLTQITDRASLSQLMMNVRLPLLMGAGLAVTYTQVPALSSTYALDPVTMTQLGTIARDTICGFGFPGQVADFGYPDINGNSRTFSPSQIQALYIVLRDYTFNLTSSVSALVFQVQGAALPPATATINVPSVPPLNS